jgi:RNA polymerase sigma-70 factor (ECF subfamily)
VTLESTRELLRHTLLVRYDDLKRRLTRRLGSADLANEALQDTYLRLETMAETGPIRRPLAYLFRTALNIGINRRIADSRLLTASEVDALLEVADETPDPARIVEARSEISALGRALAELPVRRRQIFLASWVDGVSHMELAARFGVSLRTIQSELRSAVDHCAKRLHRQIK